LLLTNLGWIASEQGDYAQAESYLRESVSLASQVGNQWLLCGTLKFLGDLQVMQKQFEAAEAKFRKVLEIAAEGNQRMKGEALFGLAEVAAGQGDYVEARKQGEASLAVFESIGQNTTSKVRHWLDDLPAPDS
jgi:tetratricopeptide (TPR) repeat protein